VAAGFAGVGLAAAVAGFAGVGLAAGFAGVGLAAVSGLGAVGGFGVSGDEVPIGVFESVVLIIRTS